MESSKRSLSKTLTWYISHLSIATSVAFVVTGSFTMAATIASLEILWEAGLYFVHERAWATFGKKVK
jgi:uncharacterized membrane protein